MLFLERFSDFILIYLTDIENAPLNNSKPSFLIWLYERSK